MGPVWTFPWVEFVFWGAARKTAYKLTFKSLKLLLLTAPNYSGKKKNVYKYFYF
jgi:hypothetical protein